MKKFLIGLLFLIAGVGAFAESDLQAATQPLSLYQAKYITWDQLRYVESLGFRYSGNVFEVNNHNYLWHNNIFGFYESVNIMVKNQFGVGLALGPCAKFYDGKYVQLAGGLGVHTVFYTPEHIELGIETDFSAKFLKDKMFSPVAGLCLSFDFLTNGTSDVVVDSVINALINSFAADEKVSDEVYIEKELIRDNTIKTFLVFCVMPYLAVSWNF